jgi:hypothetical protein
MVLLLKYNFIFYFPVLEFMQTYGWFILLAGIVAYFIKRKVAKNYGGTRPSQEGLDYGRCSAQSCRAVVNRTNSTFII